jgi:hypothetical protein
MITIKIDFIGEIERYFEWLTDGIRQLDAVMDAPRDRQVAVIEGLAASAMDISLMSSIPVSLTVIAAVFPRPRRARRKSMGNIRQTFVELHQNAQQILRETLS